MPSKKARAKRAKAINAKRTEPPATKPPTTKPPTTSVPKERVDAVLDWMGVTLEGSSDDACVFSSPDDYSRLVVQLLEEKLPTIQAASGELRMSTQVTTLVSPVLKEKIFRSVVDFLFPFKPQIADNLVTVHASPISGQGVFATDAIPPNTVVSYYPMDFLCIDLEFGNDGDCYWIMSRDPKTRRSGQLGPNELRPFNEHWHDLRGDGAVTFGANPHVYTSYACAHKCNAADYPMAPGVSNAKLEWYAKGVPVLVLRTGHQGIAKGQEVLVNYGHSYWNNWEIQQRVVRGGLVADDTVDDFTAEHDLASSGMPHHLMELVQQVADKDYESIVQPGPKKEDSWSIWSISGQIF